MSYYIRTKSSIFEVVDENNLVYRVKAKGNPNNIYSKSKCQTNVIKQGFTIEELCDKFIVVNKYNNTKHTYNFNKLHKRIEKNKTYMDDHDSFNDRLEYLLTYNKVYGAIWTCGEHGEPILKPVTELNDKGDWGLL